MDDLITQVNRLNSELTQSIKLLRKNGDEYARAESEYQIAKAQTVLNMKDAGASVTEISLSIKGQPEVAEKLFKRDVAKVMYEANQEHINTVKLQLRLLDNQIAREWSQNG
jgi:Holliday junction resolvasome RuvABC ATP-dependent DNA helicase subunit